MSGDAQMTSMSASSFISDHEGFLGSIKNSTRDFVVTEIDINGQPVTQNNTAEVTPHSSNIYEKCLGEQSKREDNIGFNRRIETPTADEDDVSCQNGDSEVLNQECFDLSLILGELERFTATMRLGSGASEGEAQHCMELSLGTFPDKLQRTIVHRAVRHNFPFLMTLTNHTEIRVKEDPDYKELARLVSEEESENFFRFIDAKGPDSVFTFQPDDSKEHRTSVHHFLSRRFGKLVETKSFTDQQQTSITVRLRERGKPPRKRSAAEAQEEEVTYTAFTLRKENLETLEAISYMAAVLGVLPSDFTYAGIKDKRAITYQSMVVKKTSPERLREKSSEFERKGMLLSHIRSVSGPLRLGRLQGNHFDLVVRDLRPHGNRSQGDLESLVKEAVENTKVRGFVNYYGPQRFGSGQSVQADQIGLALLKEEMVTAVRLFFTPEEGDDLQNKAKRHFLLTENAKESLALMPGYKARERLMLRALHRYGTGHEGCTRAWLSLPHGMRVFYLHAYCSRVWNEAAVARLRRLGHKPTQGDLVWAGQGQEETGETRSPRIHVVSAAEAEENVFSLGQVVLPMPGNSVQYPENGLGGWYQERLARDGLACCRFRVTPLKLNVPGCYRPLLAYPRGITHRLDMQGNGQSQQLDNTPSLSLTFDLEASCYATVCLREVMKCDL